MRNSYLNKIRKKSYMKDFNNLLELELDFWELDSPELKEILRNINTNDFIQTLYSQSMPQGNPGKKTSYLTFAYNASVELEVFRNIIPHFIQNYNYNSGSKYAVCWYNFSLPKENENYNKGSKKLGLASTDNKNYFMINHIHLNLECENFQIHTEFWNDLNLKLSTIK